MSLTYTEIVSIIDQRLSLVYSELDTLRIEVESLKQPQKKPEVAKPIVDLRAQAFKETMQRKEIQKADPGFDEGELVEEIKETIEEPEDDLSEYEQ